MAPEHTVVSLELAVAIGAAWVSVELRRTADDELVLLRCSDLRGATDIATAMPDRSPFQIEDLTLAEAVGLDVGRWHPSQYHGERLTSLAAALDRLGGRIGIVLDVPIGPRNVGMDAAVVAALRAHPELHTAGTRIAVRSRDLDVLSRVRADVPGTITLARLGASAARHSLPLVPEDVDGVTVPWSAVDAELCRAARARGLAVTVDQVGSLDQAHRARALDVEAIETSEPRVIRGLTTAT